MTHQQSKDKNVEHFQQLRNDILKDESFQLIRELNFEKEHVYGLKEHIRINDYENTHKFNVLNAKINSIYASTSWRLTYPLRLIKNLLNKSNIKNTPVIKSEVTKDYQYWIKTIEPSNVAKKLIVNDYLFNIFIYVSEENIDYLSSSLNSIHINDNKCVYLHIFDTSNKLKFKIKNILLNFDFNYNIILNNSLDNNKFLINIYKEISENDWILWLNSGDCIAKNCLNEFAISIVNNINAKIIYSDEDNIEYSDNNNYTRVNPHFKPDFNLLNYYSTQYINYSFAIKADIFKCINLIDDNSISNFTLNIILKSIEALKIDFSYNKTEIIHISKILFHINKLNNNMNYSNNKVFLENHLKNQVNTYEVTQVNHNYGLRITNKFKETPLVSIIIPTRNGLHLLSRCVTSIIEKTTYKNFEILVVDNGSDDIKTLNYLKNIECDFVRVIRDNSPFNYSSINNNAVKHTRGEFVCLMNNDTEVISEDWLTEMLSYAVLPGIGCVGAKLLYPNNKVQHGGVILGIGGLAGHCHWNLEQDDPSYFNRGVVAQELSAVTAACLLVKKTIYEEVGGLDPKLAVAFNDVNFCLDVLQAGYKNIWTPFAKLYHFESASRGYEDTPEKIARFNQEVDFVKNKWGNLINKDPSYNINLCLKTTVSVFKIRFSE